LFIIGKVRLFADSIYKTTGNMKKVTGLVLIILMAFIAVPAKSQLKFGVKGGLNISSVHLNSDILKADNVTGFQIGPMIETTIPLIGVGLDAAILYSQKGMDVKSETGTSTNVKTDYIDVPVNLKWKLSEHMAGIGGVIGGLVSFSALFGYNPVGWLCLFILIAGILGSARIVLGHHTLGEVLSGFAVGLICALLVLHPVSNILFRVFLF
jgi:hypothetical protein